MLSFLKKGGARQASNEALEEFCKIMEEISLDIAKRSVLFAEDDQRLKVIPEDVRKAKEEFLRTSILLLS
jgi:histone H3/H4